MAESIRLLESDAFIWNATRISNSRNVWELSQRFRLL